MNDTLYHNVDELELEPGDESLESIFFRDLRRLGITVSSNCVWFPAPEELLGLYR